MTMIIGLSGKKGSGKTVIARELCHLLSRRGGLVVRRSFADALKSFAVQVLGCDFDAVRGTNDQKNTPSPIHWQHWDFAVGGNSGLDRPMTHREVLQQFGHFVRRVKSDAWVRACLDRIDNAGCPPAFAIIDDVRHGNEADAIHERGGVVIRIQSGEKFALERDQHTSETELDDYSGFLFTYLNDRTQQPTESAYRIVSGIQFRRGPLQ